MSNGPAPLPLIEYPDWLRASTREARGPVGPGAGPGSPPGPGTAPGPAVPSTVPPAGPAAKAPEKSDTLSDIADFFATYTDVLGWVLDPKLGIAGAAEYVSFITGASAEALGTGLNVAGSVLTAVVQYRDSTATTVVGKTVDAAGAGAIDWGLGTIHPAVPVVDKVVGLVFEHGLGVKGVSIADNLNTSVRSIVTVTEGVITGDTSGMESFHERSLAGEYTPVFRWASEAGDYWADTGIGDGLEDFGSELGDFTGLW